MTATATPAALSQLLLQRWKSTALETDKAHWVWGIKNESGRKWNIIGILETLEGPKQLRVSEMKQRRRGRVVAVAKGVSGEFIAINRFRVAVGRDRQLIKNSAAIATIEWNLRWQHTPRFGNGRVEHWAWLVPVLSFIHKGTNCRHRNQQSAIGHGVDIGIRTWNAESVRFWSLSINRCWAAWPKVAGQSIWYTLLIVFGLRIWNLRFRWPRNVQQNARNARRAMKTIEQRNECDATRHGGNAKVAKRNASFIDLCLSLSHSTATTCNNNNNNNVSRLQQQHNNSQHCLNNPIGQGPRQCGNAFKIKHPKSDAEPGNDLKINDRFLWSAPNTPLVSQLHPDADYFPWIQENFKLSKFFTP